MPTESLTLLNSTTFTSGKAGLESSPGERPAIVSRSFDADDGEPNHRTSPTQLGSETAAEPRRPRKRFPRLMPVFEAAREDFSLLEKWDGVVLSVTGDRFTARLYRAGGPSHITEAAFSKSELSSEERGQIQEGASFVWTIGYRHIGATRRRDSVLYFRRLLPWQKQELETAELRGTELKNSIGWR